LWVCSYSTAACLCRQFARELQCGILSLHTSFELGVVDGVQQFLEEGAWAHSGGGEIVSGDEGRWGDGDSGLLDRFELGFEEGDSFFAEVELRNGGEELSRGGGGGSGEEAFARRYAGLGGGEERGEGLEDAEHFVEFFVGDFEGFAHGAGQLL